MIYNSAGHHNKDSGATATHGGIKYQENTLMMQMRDLINKRLDERGYKYINDNDNETLAQYLGRIKSGTGSVIFEGHLNSFVNSTATGIEIIIPDNASEAERRLASIMAIGLNKITGIVLRNNGTGVITEKQSKRGSLGIMRKPGINLLAEYGFISNPNDLRIILEKKTEIANFVADCLIIGEDWFT
jgi:N-acetylmuramoyl-L-alanine amidase